MLNFLMNSYIRIIKKNWAMFLKKLWPLLIFSLILVFLLSIWWLKHDRISADQIPLQTTWLYLQNIWANTKFWYLLHGWEAKTQTNLRILTAWPRGYKTWVHSQIQNKGQWLAACGHVAASSQSLRFILSLRLYSSFITLRPGKSFCLLDTKLRK